MSETLQEGLGTSEFLIEKTRDIMNWDTMSRTREKINIMAERTNRLMNKSF